MAKTNIYAFVYYLDSISDAEMFGRLESEHFQAVLSPVHDSDEYVREDIVKLARHKAAEHDVVWWEWDDEGYRGVQSELDSHKQLPDRMLWKRGGHLPVGLGQVAREDVEYDSWLLPRVGDVKKAHRHVMVKLDYSATLETMKNLLQFEHSRIAYFEPVRSRAAYTRYLCHLDSEDKHRYYREDVVAFGGFDLSPLYTRDEAQKQSEFEAIYNLVADNPKITLSVLIDRLMENGNVSAAYTVKGSAGFWSQYLRDRNFIALGDTEMRRAGRDAQDAVEEFAKTS